MNFDVEVADHGTVHRIIPRNERARGWLQMHTEAIWWAGSVCVEPRYTVDLLLGMQEDGFLVPLERGEG